MKRPDSRINQYRVPGTGAARESLREKGQFWTPDWITEAMVEYVLSGGSDHLFDPAVGPGAFFRAAKAFSSEHHRQIQLQGMDIDPSVFAQSHQLGLSAEDFTNVRIADFVLDPPARKPQAIVANPPYIRHHRLSQDTKDRLKVLGAATLGQPLDGRAGLHVYFLLQALRILKHGGRLAFIMPADTCEGVFAKPLWNWIIHNFRLEAVITFDPHASPFPQIDTNPLIFMIRNAEPAEDFLWARCHDAFSDDLKMWVRSGFQRLNHNTLTVTQRSIAEAISTGLSRPPASLDDKAPLLGDFAKVVRGVATGANDFFFLTLERVLSLGIPARFFSTAIGRTRDVPGNEITSELMRSLQAQGRPTALLHLNNISPDEFPPSLVKYLASGEALGLPQKPLISQRTPWYHMERRTPPPILFAYLGRRNVRFIRNHVGVIPLTSFLCVYSHDESDDGINRLWQVLNHEETIANLLLVGKSYGAGAVKVEPRALERLPLPSRIVDRAGLSCLQQRLF
ncbi:MAG: N-6 DNA methylase [Anaerolineales bacterium]|nr:N-6 DNA methylase [Anaerolineales bacterium]